MHKYLVSFCCIFVLNLTVLAGNVFAAGQDVSDVEKLIEFVAEKMVQIRMKKNKEVLKQSMKAQKKYIQSIYNTSGMPQKSMHERILRTTKKTMQDGIDRLEADIPNILHAEKVAMKGVMGAAYLRGEGLPRDQELGCDLLRASGEQGISEFMELYNQFCIAERPNTTKEIVASNKKAAAPKAKQDLDDPEKLKELDVMIKKLEKK